MIKNKEKDSTIQEPTKADEIVEPLTNVSNSLYNELGGQDKPFLFNCIVDTKGYTEKPTGYEIGSISNRLAEGKELKVKAVEFKKLLKEGKSYLAGHFKDRSVGRKKDNIENINFFSLDIDNHYIEDKKDIYTQYTIQDTTEHIESLINIRPILSYETFSKVNINGSKRFRLIYGIDKEIDSKSLNKLLKHISLNSGDMFDKSAVDESRIFFSTDSEIIEYKNYKLLDHKVIDKLIEQAEANKKRDNPSLENSPKVEKIKKTNINTNYKDDEIDQLKQIDLGDYLQSQGYSVKPYSEGYKMPCPIHNGVNDNFIINYKNGNWIYKCFSKCRSEGTIIDLHKELNHLETGQAIKELKEMYNIKDDYKVEVLQKTKVVEEVQEPKKDKQPDSLYNYMANKFTDDIKSYSKFKDRKTGFKNLDDITSLYPGLYVIGGLSTLGKTTFIHQLADQMAEQGEHILFFSLEMATLELITKSLARLTALDENGIYTKGGINSTKIRLKDFKPGDSEKVQKAIKDYEPISKRFNIIEGNFDTNINQVRQYVETYVKDNKVDPIVIVDYLQIMPGDSESWNNKDKIDKIVTGLKQMSRDYNITVIVVSSFNRSNYLTPVDFESFKESGGIEYSADVVWGLQLSAIRGEIFNSDKKIKEKRDIINKAKLKIPRDIDLVCLKNRNGISNYSCKFTYYANNDLFISEDSTGEEGFTTDYSNVKARRV